MVNVRYCCDADDRETQYFLLTLSQMAVHFEVPERWHNCAFQDTKILFTSPICGLHCPCRCAWYIGCVKAMWFMITLYFQVIYGIYYYVFFWFSLTEYHSQRFHWQENHLMFTRSFHRKVSGVCIPVCIVCWTLKLQGEDNYSERFCQSMCQFLPLFV